MFKIENGRESFYQWDLNQKLIVEDYTVTEVHFCNKTDDCSLVVEVKVDAAARLRYAEVPNILLQSAWDIRAYAYCGDCYTKQSARFKVIARSKPADYVYSETQIKTSLTIGTSNINDAPDSLVLGYENEATVDAKGSLVAGKGNKARKNYVTVLGRSCEANNFYSFSGGKSNIVDGQSCFVYGGANYIGNVESAAILGNSNTVERKTSIALGAGNKIKNTSNDSGTGAIAIGLNNINYGKESILIGTDNQTNRNNSYIFGRGLIGYGNKTVVGRYNTEGKSYSEIAFVVGIGKDENSRKDGLILWDNGRLELPYPPIADTDAVRLAELKKIKPEKIAMHDITNSKMPCGASGSASAALGEGTSAIRYAQTVVGTYNDNSSDANTRFVVGGGADASNKFNALMVHKDGYCIAGRSTKSTDKATTLVTKDYVDKLYNELLNKLGGAN